MQNHHNQADIFKIEANRDYLSGFIAWVVTVSFAVGPAMVLGVMPLWFGACLAAALALAMPFLMEFELHQRRRKIQELSQEGGCSA